MKQRDIRILLIVGIVVGAVALPVIATHLTNDVTVSGPVPLGAPNGLVVTLDGNTNAELDNFTQGSDTIILTTEDGNATVQAGGPANVTIHASNITGTWTNATSIDADTNDITIDPEDKAAVTVGGQLQTISWIHEDSVALDDGTRDFVYSGPDGTTSKVTISGVPASTQIAAVDADTRSVLDVATSDSTGTITFSELENSEHTVELIDASNTKAPEQSNAQPTGEVSETPDELSVDIADGDFPEDEVFVQISLDGSQIHSENITSNQTVNTSNFGTLDLGDHTWTVNTSDEYGNHNNQTYSFTLPSNITFRNESNASQIVTGVNVTATFYSADGTTVITRSDDNDDGNISLRGLPNTEFVVTVEADGHYDRRAYIESIFQQEDIYLLNETAFPAAIDTTFVYEDRTGSFPPDETALRVQRAVDKNNDNTSEWQTIAGDYWGAAGEFPFTGQYQTRYRLVIENTETNRQRILGTHIPTANGSKDIIVGQIEWGAENGTGRFFDANMDVENNQINFLYIDPTDETRDIRVRVHQRRNTSAEIYDENFTTGPYGRLEIEIPVTENQSEETWVVNYTASHDRHGDIQGQTLVGGSPFGLPVDPWLLGTLCWVFATFVACGYGPRTATMGAWALVLVAGILMLFQWVYIPVSSYVVATAVAAGGTFYREGMP